MQDTGFEVVHEENLRQHYALTLKAWNANLQTITGTPAVADVGETDRQGMGALPRRIADRVRNQCGSAAPGSGRQARRARVATAVCRCARGGTLRPAAPRST